MLSARWIARRVPEILLTKAVQHPADALFRLHPVIVPLHQLTDPFLSGIVEPQPVHDAVGNAAGNHPVPHEMSNALCIQCKALRLTHIVKQHRPAEHRV